MSEAESTLPKPSFFRRLLKPLMIVFFFIMALGSASTSLLFSVLSGFLGLYTIGPINRLFNRSLPRPAVTGPAVYVLFLLAWSYALVLAVDKFGEEAAAEFAANREQIIAQAKSALEGEDYRTVIELADKHLTVNDSELNRLSAEAETALDERAKAEAAKSDAEAEQRRAQREADAAQRREREKQERLAEKQRRAKMTNKELFESDSTKAFVWMENDKDVLRATLKDSRSAEFKDTYISFFDDSPVTCGQVNAKNEFGGYGGFKRFMSARIAGISVIEGENMEIDEFTDVWRQSCINPIEM